MALSKWATRTALVLAVPIAALASLIELVAIRSSDAFLHFEAYQLADTIYLVFGYPLTRIAFILAPGGLQDNQNWWGIPLLNVLLIYQWVIWLQAVVVIGKMFQYAWRRIEAPFQPQPICWPNRIVKADGRRFKMRSYRARRRPPEKVHQ
jgi:hypothetical protein